MPIGRIGGKHHHACALARKSRAETSSREQASAAIFKSSVGVNCPMMLMEIGLGVYCFQPLRSCVKSLLELFSFDVLVFEDSIAARISE